MKRVQRDRNTAKERKRELYLTTLIKRVRWRKRDNKRKREGREPWYSGYGRRLMSKGREFESRHRIQNFFHIYLL